MRCVLSRGPKRRPRLAIKVVAKCDGSDAVFEMLNEGEKWPALAKVLIYRTDNKAVLSSRTLKMAGGQRLVHKTKGSTQGKIEIGFRIEPEWYDRPLAFDTAITCE